MGESPGLGAKSPKGERSYTYDSLMRLNNIENCLIDMRRSRDNVMANIEGILERENNKLLLEREKNSESLRLNRYEDDIAKQRKKLEEEQHRLTTLRENFRSRRAALEDARKRCQTGYEYLEESQRKLERDRFKVVLNGVHVLSEALSVTSSRLFARQRELIADLLTIFPIEPIDNDALSFKILGLPLPNSVFNHGNDEQIATALGFTCHLTQMLAFYLAIPLRFPMTPMSSRSIINDPISASIPAPRQEFIPPSVAYIPFLGLLNLILVGFFLGEGGLRYVTNNNQLGALFPLYMKGVDRGRFEYAVFLLNKNIEQLMNSQGLLRVDLRNTLPNLKHFIIFLISTSSNHYRKFVPHNCTISANNNSSSVSNVNSNNNNELSLLHSNRSGIASGRSSINIPYDQYEIGVEVNSNNLYHHQNYDGPPSRSSSRSSTRSFETVNNNDDNESVSSTPKRTLLSPPIAISRVIESHRRRTAGFE
ncbi:3172_t:CDS:10, partial [Ambispora gerdemannii]